MLWEVFPSEVTTTPPPQAGAAAEACGYHSVHVTPWVYPEVNLVDDPSPHYKGEHEHPGYCHVGISVEGGGVDHQHPPEGKCSPPWYPTWVPRSEGNEDGDLGD